MHFRVRYHNEVVGKDIPGLDRSVRDRIRKAVEERLANDPSKYGKPLRKSLHGLRRLRAGEFQVVFLIEGEEVLVVAIGHKSRIHGMAGSGDPARGCSKKAEMQEKEDRMNDVKNLKFDSSGLIPVIVQDKDTGEVLMMAWMNEEAVKLTRGTGFAHYWSRSRQKLWKKGETSGHVQAVSEVLFDCDADCLLLKVEQKTAACHTGHRSCFHRVLGGGRKGRRVFDPGKVYAGQEAREVLDQIYGTVIERKKHPRDDSYTNQLLAGGMETVGKKLMEEAFELSLAGKEGERQHIIAEAADLLYHAWVLLGAADVTPEEVYAELLKRTGKSGLQEKAERKKEDKAGLAPQKMTRERS